MTRALLAILTAVASAVTSIMPAQIQPTKNSVPTRAAGSGRPISDVERRIADLELKLAKLTARLENLVNVVDDNLANLMKLKHESVNLDPASPNTYHRVDTYVGPLLVSIIKTEPYLDGYKVVLMVGNPLGVTFHGFGMNVTYGPNFRTGDTYVEWKRQQRSKTFKFTEALPSASQDNVELILTDTKPTELGFITVSVEVDQLSFGR